MLAPSRFHWNLTIARKFFLQPVWVEILDQCYFEDTEKSARHTVSHKIVSHSAVLCLLQQPANLPRSGAGSWRLSNIDSYSRFNFPVFSVFLQILWTPSAELNAQISTKLKPDNLSEFDTDGVCGFGWQGCHYGQNLCSVNLSLAFLS